MLTLYGIANCDTVKKARNWLSETGTRYAFHDYKKSGVESLLLTAWVEARGWETILNRAGTTFRALSDPERSDIDAAKAVQLMLAQPSLIKRPILVGPGLMLVGFKPQIYAAAIG